MKDKDNIDDISTEWPIDSLESVENCPICGSRERRLLHKGLADRVFFCAPGKWTIYRCESCSSSYLNPRPTRDSIGLAYQNYFTHQEDATYSSLSFSSKIRRRFANAYRNYRYGTNDFPASILGVLAALLMPNGRSIIDAGMRHLPKLIGAKRLLDIGCGNGIFLLRARSAGWNVVGLDMDSKAVEIANRHGLDVRLGGVETLDPSFEQFDVITLSHVIEHVHNPRELLEACNILLKPGGFLWIETPNLNSIGYGIYGEDWVHLDPPRHLTLFTQESLCNLLSSVGFVQSEIQPYRPLCESDFRASKAIKEGKVPFSEMCQDESFELIKKSERICRLTPERREYITIKTWKKC